MRNQTGRPLVCIARRKAITPNQAMPSNTSTAPAKPPNTMEPNQRSRLALNSKSEKPNKPKHVSVSAEAAAAHAIIKEFDFQAFADVMQARNFITNKLVGIANCGDPKVEIKALELLGKHSDIGLFTERSEITINHTTSSALENSIKERVKRLLNSDVSDVTSNLIDELDEIKPKKAENVTEASQTDE
jgi:hypothetical protein